MNTTELDIYRGAPLEERQQYALTLARAVDILPKALRKVNPQDPDAARQETAARAFLIMETGDMLGLHPMAALAGVNVIEGKPALSSGLMSAVIRSAGHKLHVTETGTIEGGDYKATATLIREDDPDHPFSSTWTPHRAQRAGLCKYEEGANGIWKVTARSQGGSPLPWEAYTESLCKSRAISEVSRDGGQDALLGIRYTPEELESGVDDIAPAAVEAPAEEAKPARKTPARGRQGTKRKAAPVDMPTEPTAEEAKPAEDIVDAVEVTPEQEEAEERARAAAEAEAKVREQDAADEAAQTPAPEVTPEALAKLRDARMPDAQPGESEVDYQQRKLAEKATAKAATAENEARPFVDTFDGATYATQEELDAVLAARVKAKRAERAAEVSEAPSEPQGAGEPDPFQTTGEPHPFDLAFSEEPENYERQTEAATTVEQVKDVWDRATEANAMTTALRLAIVKRKAAVLGPVEA